MLTYQDLLKVGESEKDKIQFTWNVIKDHQGSTIYKNAQIAEEYRCRRNVTITKYQKFLTKMTGEVVPDLISANYKLPSNFYARFNTQLVQYLLGNGITWNEETTSEKLGKDFEAKMIKLAKEARTGGEAFGFWNLDHLEVFSLLEYAPLYDEEDGSMKAGVRFWRLAQEKPLRATLFELDGYTDYVWKDGTGEVLNEKRPYVLNIKYTEEGGEEIVDGENYEAFPIVPLWADDTHQSPIVGIRENIDAYDLIKSGFCNTIDEASIVYWTVNNAGGMDDVDLAEFLKKIRTMHGAFTDDGATATPNTINAPHEGREALLDRIRADLYEDAMALDTKNIAGGAVTATQIEASYEPLNSKADDFEYEVTKFLDELLKLIGIDDEPTYTRSKIINVQEEIETIVSSAQYLNDEYVAKKILSLLGDADKAEEVLSGLVEDRLYDRAGTAEESGAETNK